jgi:hypothetical protein
MYIDSEKFDLLWYVSIENSPHYGTAVPSLNSSNDVCHARRFQAGGTVSRIVGDFKT